MKSNHIHGYHLSRRERHREQYRYAAAALLKRAAGENTRRIGVVSSQSDQDSAQRAFLLLARELSALEPKSKIFVLDTPTVPTPEGVEVVWGKVDPAWLREQPAFQAQELPAPVLVYLPPVRLFVDSLDCLSLCEGVVLLERYGYTPYHGFEETLWKLKERGQRVLGVFAAK